MQNGIGAGILQSDVVMMAGWTMAHSSSPIAAHDVAPEDLATDSRQTSIYVSEAPVRIWHRVSAAVTPVLTVSSYFVGSPFWLPEWC